MPLAARALDAVKLAPDVFLLPGVVADADVGNRGRVVNIGIIVGHEGSVVIDSGTSREHGELILAAAERLGGRPVRLLVNTHPHPQNVLGNSAFAARGIPILATQQTRAMMAERCPRCLAASARAIGAANLAGTAIVLPDITIAASETRVVAGRRLRLLHLGHAHSEGDLAVLDVETGVLFAGDVVYRDQLPHLAEADLAGWLAALEVLRREPVSVLVPGRGAPGAVADLEPLAAYLDALRASVGAAYAAGLSPDETLERAALPTHANWEGYAARHGRNVQHVYFALERAELAAGQGQ